MDNTTIALTGTNFSNEDKYAPIFEIPKHTSYNMYCGDACRHVVRLNLVGENIEDNLEAYISEGYSPGDKKHYYTFKMLKEPTRMKIFAKEYEDKYIFYVCSNTYNTKINCQLIMSNNPGMINGISFSKFTVAKEGTTISLSKEQFLNVQGIYETSQYIDGNQYTKIAEMNPQKVTSGINFVLEFLQTTNMNEELVTGKIYIKVVHGDTSIHDVRTRINKIEGSSDFTKNFLNVFIVQRKNSNICDVCLQIKSHSTGYVFKPTICTKNDMHKCYVNFFENQPFVAGLPEGEKTDYLFY